MGRAEGGGGHGRGERVLGGGAKRKRRRRSCLPLPAQLWRSKLMSFDFTKLISGDIGGISTLISSFDAIGIVRKERDDDGTGSFGTAWRVQVKRNRGQ